MLSHYGEFFHTFLFRYMAVEFMGHVNVSHVENLKGVTSRRVTTFCNCIGVFSIPAQKNISDMGVLVKTGKGATASCSPVKIA